MGKVNINYDVYTGDQETLHKAIDILVENNIDFSMNFNHEESKCFNVHGNGETDCVELLEELFGGYEWNESRW